MISRTFDGGYTGGLICGYLKSWLSMMNAQLTLVERFRTILMEIAERVRLGESFVTAVGYYRGDLLGMIQAGSTYGVTNYTKASELNLNTTLLPSSFGSEIQVCTKMLYPYFAGIGLNQGMAVFNHVIYRSVAGTGSVSNVQPGPLTYIGIENVSGGTQSRDRIGSVLKWVISFYKVITTDDITLYLMPSDSVSSFTWTLKTTNFAAATSADVKNALSTTVAVLPIYQNTVVNLKNLISVRLELMDVVNRVEDNSINPRAAISLSYQSLVRFTTGLIVDAYRPLLPFNAMANGDWLIDFYDEGSGDIFIFPGLVVRLATATNYPSGNDPTLGSFDYSGSGTPDIITLLDIGLTRPKSFTYGGNTIYPLRLELTNAPIRYSKELFYNVGNWWETLYRIY